MPSKQKIFDRKMRELIKRSQTLTKVEVRGMLQLLKDVRKEVSDIVATTPWQLYNLDTIKQAIDKTFKDLKSAYVTTIQSAQEKAWNLGVDFVDEPLEAIGFFLPTGEINYQLVATMQGFSADLITNLTDDAIQKINTQITLGIMGAETPFETMKKIGTSLGTDKSVFKSIASRAELVTRTEMGRVFSIAEEARLEEAGKNLPGLQKEWYHSPYVRNPRDGTGGKVNHVAMDGQRVPVNEPFISPDGARIMMPRGPVEPASKSAKHTIGCNCGMMPYHPNWDKAVVT